jgi:hypothetical protein
LPQRFEPDLAQECPLMRLDAHDHRMATVGAIPDGHRHIITLAEASTRTNQRAVTRPARLFMADV